MRMIALAAILAVCFAGLAHASPPAAPVNLPPLVAEALEAADQAAENVERLRFLRKKLGPSDVTFTALFDPAQQGETQWQILSPPEAIRSSDQRQSIAILEKQRDPDLQLIIKSALAMDLLSEDLQRVSETDETVTFESSVGMLPGSQDAPGPIDPERISRHLKAEMVIAKSPAKILSLRVYAPEAFKPIFAAKIDTLDILMGIEEAWAGGPLAVTRVDRKIAGSAFYVSFAEHVRLAYSAFEAAPAINEAASPMVGTDQALETKAGQ